MMNRKKIALIGAGNIGSTMAHLCMIKNLGDVVLFDIKGDNAKGKALDILQAARIHNSYVNVTGSDQYSDIEGSDVIIITAGVARKPGMSRDDLLSINSSVMKDVGESIKQYAPNAFVIVITNPLDIMVGLVQKHSGLPTNKVVGMAGVLDSSRFTYLLAQSLNVSVNDINGFVLGGHGDTMVPVLEYTTVSGVSISTLIQQGKISQERIDDIIQRTKTGGGEIVQLLGNGSAYFAPAASAISMAESYLHNKRAIVSCAAWVDNGKYGITEGLYVGVPVIIGSGGVEEVIELKLESKTQEMFNTSINAVKKLLSQV